MDNFKLLLNTNRLSIMTADKRMLHKNISVSLGMLWRRLSPAEKRIYEIEAEREKIKHRLKFPNYKYRPRRKIKEPGEYPDTLKNFSAPSTSGLSSQKTSFDEDNVSCYDYQNHNNYSTPYYTKSIHNNHVYYDQSNHPDQVSYIQHSEKLKTMSFEQKTNGNFNTSHPSVSRKLMVTTNNVVPSNHLDTFGNQRHGDGGIQDSNLFGEPNISVSSLEIEYSQERNHQQGVAKQPSLRLLNFKEPELMGVATEEMIAREQHGDVIPSMDMIGFEEFESVKN